MTALSKLTDGQLLFRLQDVYGAEQDAIKINDHEYAQECSDIVSVIREVMESRKALEAAEKRIAELEHSETQLINERDDAESALNDAYKA
ncbi:ead/Ea22-like family protein, partial [Citrobacter portucalensis]|nr:ead/Ea22-like family protein [Citrobacter portucalensis]